MDDIGSDTASQHTGPIRADCSPDFACSPTMMSETQLVVQPSGYGGFITKDNILQDLAEKSLPLEENDLSLGHFEHDDDINLARISYHRGRAVRHVIEGAFEPVVSIVFIPGVDRVTVNQQEELGMTKGEIDQKDAQWRALTGGTLLSHFEVDKSLTIISKDNTAAIVASARARREKDSSSLATTTAIIARTQGDDTVTIDSEKVKIVADHSDSSDISVTLIEVDQASLWSLIIDYRQIIHQGGPVLTPESTTRLLEAMIENARRLAIRSPTLFRMSTRQRIIQSRDTRYGVDHGTVFQTLTTSGGIKDIISRSAAYYNSLASPGGVDNAQRVVRPTFLQMLTLLLSLLNDIDLKALKPFLESTYGIRADRLSIELLILKVLPLMSINSKIFIREMVNTVEQRQYPRLPDDSKAVWEIFVSRLPLAGYILPGYTEQMGQRGSSWIVKYEDFKDSFVFNNLQLNGDLRTANEIPSIDLSMESEAGEVTVLLTNGHRYLIENFDHHKTTGMIYGTYPVTECEGSSRTMDINITETCVNESLTVAISSMNTVIGYINAYFTAPKLRRTITKRLTNAAAAMNIASVGRSDRVGTIPDIKPCGRLTCHQAQLGNDLLASAYKIEGKKISRRDLIRNLAADMRKVRGTLRLVDMEMKKYEGRRVTEEVRKVLSNIRQTIPGILQNLGDADYQKSQLEAEIPDLAGEPIVQTIYAGRAETCGGAFWSPYRVWAKDTALGRRSPLRIDCKRDVVRSVHLVNEEVAEVALTYDSTTLFVSPLRKLTAEEWEDEIQTQDHVLLLGGYLVIVASDDDDGEGVASDSSRNSQHSDVNPTVQNGQTHTEQYRASGPRLERYVPERFVTWLRITAVETQRLSRRSKNRQRPESSMVETEIR